MRIKSQSHYQPQGSSPTFTLRSLFSRRSKRGRTCKPPPSHRTSLILPQANTRNDSTSTSTVRANGLRLDKELEILGLLTDPRKGAQPVFLDTIPTTTPAAHSPPTFPIARLHEKPFWLAQEKEEQESSMMGSSSRQRNEHPSYPPSPLLPPPPTFTTSPSFQNAFQDMTSPSPRTASIPVAVPVPKAEDIAPPSPTLSYRTFATRSSGIFPWGAEPDTVEDGFGDGLVSDTLSEDQVLVLPSPPRFMGSYRYLPREIRV
ncbi:uncharacterized protein BDV17DRAFT_286349 [Aspergillus undulatus]|uniref:uncharacterized protein n=1 Tax=Aspergillus undulatus TaxID=1810928 RepID=UPI003CCD89A0